MFTLQQIVQLGALYNSGLSQAALQYIQQIANAFLQSFPLRRNAIESAISMGMLNISAIATPQAILTRMVDEISEALDIPPVVPPVLQQLPVPTIVPPPPPAFALERQRLAAARTPAVRQRGAAMVRAACQMHHWFHWVSAGPEVNQAPPGVEPVHRGRAYYPRERWEAKRTEDGWDTSKAGQDDFALWLNRGNRTPHAGWSLNCWEAIFVTAFRANLVSVQRLRLIHARATARARAAGAAAGEAYSTEINQALGIPLAVPLVPQLGLIPQAGDIIFFDGDNHVALSLGRRTENGIVRDFCMSLWHQDSGRYSVQIVEYLQAIAGRVTFWPCPF